MVPIVLVFVNVTTFQACVKFVILIDIFSSQFRDVKAVGQKFFHVLLPRQSRALLRDCK